MPDKWEKSWEGRFTFPSKLPGRVVPFGVPLPGGWGARWGIEWTQED